jgi:putative SOS response-associated peptidase YedK
MAFAGLWDKWKAPDGAVLESYSVITYDPNELAAEVHSRMPAILDESRYAKWLDPEASPREVQRREKSMSLVAQLAYVRVDVCKGCGNRHAAPCQQSEEAGVFVE